MPDQEMTPVEDRECLELMELMRIVSDIFFQTRLEMSQVQIENLQLRIHALDLEMAKDNGEAGES